MKFPKKSGILIPLWLLITSFLVYGIFIPFVGFYWDDLPYTWFKIAQGVQGTVGAIALDRPVLSIFYAIPMALFGEKPLVWQIFAILTRWLFTMSVYQFLMTLWPKRERTNQAIILLFLVFPGFTQQWISVIYSHAFIVLALYFISLTIFTKDLMSENRSFLRTFSALLLAFICMAAMEYVVGLELLRPVIAFIIEKRKTRNKPLHLIFKKVFQNWLPFLMGLIIFITYRIFLSSSVLYRVQNVDGISTAPIGTLWSLISSQFGNMYTSTILVWGSLLKPFSHMKLSSTYAKLHIGFIGFLLILSAAFLAFGKNKIQADKTDPILDNQWLKEALLISLTILFIAGIPFWAANLVPSLSFPNDRFLLPFMVGSTLIIIILLEFTHKLKWVWPFLFCSIFALSGAYQLYNANMYREEWGRFTDFFQQISMRIPSITKDTIFVTDELPFTYYSDNSLTAALNWAYAANEPDGSLPYMLNYTNNRLGTSLPSLDPGTVIHQRYRIFSFDGSTDQMVIFYYQPPGCFHIVDPILDTYNPLITPVLREAAKQSKSSLIQRSVNRNEVFFIGENEPETWCRYYQKASLAYQLEEWEEVARIGDLAFNISDYPNDASERIPFIFGYAYTGQYEKALQLAQTMITISDLYRPMVCKAWEIIEMNPLIPQQAQNFISSANEQLLCISYENDN